MTDHKMGKSAAPAPAARAATVDFEQEVRLAVVMYGGVSLAIYINGVAQELLRAVRATAPSRVPASPGSGTLLRDDQLSEVEKVYRELGRRIGLHNDWLPDANRRLPIRTRIVVDVLSGTSAGGINAVFLAKALARHQRMDELQKLWMSEADLGRLLNDATSIADLDGRIEQQKPPLSLLNSRRMYLKLLEALRGMDASTQAFEGTVPPLVDELDLFVTATDIRGLVVKLRLADQLVYERRYRNVFHFLHATVHGTGAERTDFKSSSDPFLAYAARCTSSFPMAFEPMTLSQIAEVAGSLADGVELKDAMGAWEPFFRDYARSESAPGREHDPPKGAFENRPFGDGGYLDNKPFSYAISQLSNRRADLPVQRQLIYVEPSAEHPELDRAQLRSPDAIENLLAAASSLPRQETIREDLERVLERNRLIGYINRATRNMRRDMRGEETRTESGRDWRDYSLEDMIKRYGGMYGPYHRIKVSGITTELGELVTRILDLDEKSDEVTALRYVLSAWRQANYSPDPAPQSGLLSENAFLMDFDLSYRMRRLAFVQSRIDLLLENDPRHVPGVALLAGQGSGAAAVEALCRKLAGARGFLCTLKAELAGVVIGLRAAGRSIRRRGDDNPLYPAIRSLGLSWEDLKDVLKASDEASRIRICREILGIPQSGVPTPPLSDRMNGINESARILSEQLHGAFSIASKASAELLDPEKAPPATPEGERELKTLLWEYYTKFDVYDMLLFPMMMGTDIGEASEVQVVRVSPEDATRLVRERDANTHRLKCSKLAGTRLGNFGGFLDPVWRRSDMMWGRLDGAERIIRSLMLPDSQPLAADDKLPRTQAETRQIQDDLIEDMIGRAQAAIACEELAPLGPEMGRRVLVEALLHTTDGEQDAAAVQEMLGKLRKYISSENATMMSILDPALTGSTYSRLFATSRALESERGLRLISRSTQVFGGVLDGLSDKYAGIRKSWPWWISTAGRILWGLIEIAVPRSLFEAIGTYWISFIYVFLGLMMIAGILMKNEPLRGTSALGLVILAAIDFGRRWVGAALRKPDADSADTTKQDAPQPGPDAKPRGMGEDTSLEDDRKAFLKWRARRDAKGHKPSRALEFMKRLAVVFLLVLAALGVRDLIGLVAMGSEWITANPRWLLKALAGLAVVIVVILASRWIHESRSRTRFLKEIREESKPGQKQA